MTKVEENLADCLKNGKYQTALEEKRIETDFELAQKSAAGDLAAFEQIYWKYHRRVFNICLRMCKDATDSEDVTQQIFLNLFKKIGSFRGDSAFATWLHRMTVNQMLMHFRAVKARREAVTEDGEMPENIIVSNHKSGGANDLAENLQLSKLIARLPEGYRKIVILHDVYGFEHEEIARMLGCAVGTSKSQLHKARRKLRVALSSGDAFSQQPDTAVS